MDTTNLKPRFGSESNTLVKDYLTRHVVQKYGENKYSGDVIHGKYIVNFLYLINETILVAAVHRYYESRSRKVNDSKPARAAQVA